MAFYTSSIKTHYYEPTVYQSKNRAEFRLDPEKIFLSNFRLLNLFPTAANNKNINKVSGVLSTVKTMELLDGSKTLCRLFNVGDYAAFQQFNNSNDENLQSSRLSRGLMGYIYSASDTSADKQIKTAQSNSTADNNRSYLDLMSLLPFLKASQVVPTQVFKNLKLVMTFTSGGIPDWTGNLTPLLAVDEMMNTDVAMSLLNNYKGFAWTEIESDQYQVPAIAQADLVNDEVRVQSTRNQLKGFDNKMVKRCFIQKKTSGKVYFEYGENGSAPQNRERLQVRKNGQNLFPGNGLDTPALIQNEVLQVWGEFNKPVLGLNYPGLINQDLLGDYYLAFDLTGNRCNELQIEYDRTVLKDNADTNNDRTSEALNMNVFGEVEKVLEVNNDMSYRVLYI